jgi:hypothetical protein
MKQDLTPAEELNFHYKYGTLFSLSTAIEYAQSIAGIYGEEGNAYAKNKAIEVEKCCGKLHAAIERDITSGLPPEEKAIALQAVEHHKGIVYDFFLLDAKDQKRISNLISKIKKEKQ